MNDIKDYSYYDVARMDAQEVYDAFETRSTGLTHEEIEEIREQHGDNTIDYGDKKSLLRQFVEAFFTPFTLVLLGLAIVSYITEYALVPDSEKELYTAIIIIVMVLISGFLTFFQNVSSSNAADELKELVKVTTNITRDGEARELDMDEVVVGDIINLAAGDMIPADLRLLEARDLFVNQSSLTGESMPVEKIVQVEVDESASSAELNNMAFLGTSVISGSGKGVVIRVGNDTMFGAVAKELSRGPEKTAFDLGIESTSKLLIRFMLIMAPLVFVLNGVTKGDWFQSLLFAISVAVGLTPEMLPVIVNANLVKGASTMSKKGTVVKNVNSIQNFGAIDVLCTDKTGTLTEDEIVLTYYLGTDGEDSERVLRHAYLNSYYQTGLRNAMDEAVIAKAGQNLDLSRLRFEKVDEVPFDFKRRRLSVVVRDHNNKTQMITKGAIEEMMSICEYVDYQGEIYELDDARRAEVLAEVNELNSQGFRVLAVAQKTSPSPAGKFSVADERDMVLIGYLAFLDPPKPSAKDAIDALKAHGVKVKVLTGDNEFVTKTVADQLHLEYDRIIFGSDIEEMDDEEVWEIIQKENIFVKLNPQQKSRLVRVMRENGKVVGFLGDGINDAPALNTADVGISVDNGTDIAKESADIILLEKDLMILEEGILEGRKIFGNIMKYIKTTTSSNFGNTFSLLLASIFLPFLPMLPVQFLFLNLIYDISCLSIPWDNMDPEYLLDAKQWRADDIGRFMIWFGPSSSIFDLTSFLALFFFLCPFAAGGAYQTLNPAAQELFIAVFHSGWFVLSLWTQSLVLHALRTPKVPFVESRPSFIFTTISTLGIVIGTIVPFTTLGTMLDLVPLPSPFWWILLLTIVAYLVTVTLVKFAYVKRYGELI